MTFGAEGLPETGTGRQVPGRIPQGGRVRLFFVGAALLISVSTTSAAQSRWTFSAGPEWTPRFDNGLFYGGRVRAEYDLITPNSPFRLRLEASGRWEPTQSYFGTLSDSSTVSGVNQTLDFTFGLSAAITPIPRSRIAPYVTLAVLARQSWSDGASSFRRPDGSYWWNEPIATRTRGDIVFVPGIGARVRIAGHTFQLEMRQWRYRSVMLGTTLPF